MINKYKTPKINLNALRIGYYSDKYFLRTQEILMKDNYEHEVHYQYFPRKNCIVCGIPQVIQILESCIGYYKNRELAWDLFSEMQDIDFYNSTPNDLLKFNQLRNKLNSLWVSKFNEMKIFSILEGSEVSNMEPVIGIIGNPKYFIHLETPTLGVLAQQSAVATSVRRANNIIHENQKLMFFPARFRHYLSQAPDGYASGIGGTNIMSTDANNEYWGYNSVGTIPHALIAAYNGNTMLAALKFDEMIDPDILRTVLVDWDNSCIETSLMVVAAFLKRFLMESSGKSFSNELDLPYSLSESETLIRDYKHMLGPIIGLGRGKIFGVRFDTSGSLTDFGISPWGEKGVCKELVYTARKTFDDLGLNNLKIVVSGGFDQEKLELFQDVPFDIVGIGSSIVNKFTVDFTADAVTLDGKPNAKVGRKLMDWSRMNIITKL